MDESVASRRVKCEREGGERIARVEMRRLRWESRSMRNEVMMGRVVHE